MTTTLQVQAATAKEELDRVIALAEFGADRDTLKAASAILDRLAGPKVFEVEVEATVSGILEVEADDEADAEHIATKAVEGGDFTTSYLTPEVDGELLPESYPGVYVLGTV